MMDIFKKYAVKNSLKRIKRSSEIAMNIAGRILGPLVHLDLPKYTTDSLMVYGSNDLLEILDDLSKNEDSDLSLEWEAGQTADNFKIWDGAEPISVLSEKSPSELFPYLLEPDYKFSAGSRKKWIAYSISSGQGKEKETVGHIFIHRFKGVFVKRRVRPSGVIRPENRNKDILLFTLIGQRSYIEYVKTKLELKSTKVPPEALNYEN